MLTLTLVSKSHFKREELEPRRGDDQPLAITALQTLDLFSTDHLLPTCVYTTLSQQPGRTGRSHTGQLAPHPQARPTWSCLHTLTLLCILTQEAHAHANWLAHTFTPLHTSALELALQTGM